MAKDLPQHKQSKLRAAGVELLAFVVGLAALAIGYRLAGWPGALLAVALAAVTIFRETNRRGPRPAGEYQRWQEHLDSEEEYYSRQRWDES